MALSQLERDDWVKKDTSGANGDVAYSFTMGLVRRWIERTNSVWDLLQEQRSKIASLSATPLRRGAAMMADVALATWVGWGLWFLGYAAAFYAGFPWHSAFEAVGAICLLYVVPLIWVDRTIGMWIAGTRLASELGETPGIAAAMGFGLAAAVPSAAIAAAAILYHTGTYSLSVALAVVGFSILAVHQFRVRKDPDNHKGIFDRFARVVIIENPRQEHTE